ncbi:MAG: A/G-specific adenine glycosylase [Pseudomonadota bacterium]
MSKIITSSRPDAPTLLAWYDQHHRDLPWRTPPVALADGVRPDPYRVWLSEIMLQQTTVATVKPYFEKFTAQWPDVHAMAAAPTEAVLAAWAGLGYYARARNLHKCARVVSQELGGVFPSTEERLRALPGIGAYTAAAVAAIAFDRHAVVVDGNVERVIARVFAIADPLPASKPTLKEAAATLTPSDRPGDYAQAVMDLGATVCTPRKPACIICPWHGGCTGRRHGVAEQLPAKAKKSAKPIRRGTAWVMVAGAGHILTERRPETGLLGGMLGVPTSVWSEDPEPAVAPLDADWASLGEVRHTFTHFHLVLDVQAARVEEANVEEARVEAGHVGGAPAGRTDIRTATSEMPTVFAKVVRLAGDFASAMPE